MKKALQELHDFPGRASAIRNALLFITEAGIAGTSIPQKDALQIAATLALALATAELPMQNWVVTGP